MHVGASSLFVTQTFSATASVPSAHNINPGDPGRAWLSKLEQTACRERTQITGLSRTITRRDLPCCPSQNYNLMKVVNDGNDNPTAEQILAAMEGIVARPAFRSSPCAERETIIFSVIRHRFVVSSYPKEVCLDLRF